jgi:hypothetical protein
MKNIFKSLSAVDLIAIITIIGGLYLKLKGADGVVGSLLVAVVFYYFGKKGVGSLQQVEDIKQNDKL